MTAAPQVVVAVLTYRRTPLLTALLPDLVAQAGTLPRPADVLVVDNDPEAGARAAVAALAVPGVRYVHEPRPGIAAARNRALDEAADADALVFLDDDELPGTAWLARLVSSWQEWGCAAVTGPVVARFTGPVDPWVAGSGAFDRRRLRTGTVMRGAATNNLLLDLAAVTARGLRFDERLGLTGGEDTAFTHALTGSGGEIRWCDEAEVVEPVAAERATRAWVLRRTFRAGSSWARARLRQAGPGPRGWAARAALAARAVARMAQATAALAVAAAHHDLPRRGRATCQLVSHAGLLAGLGGFVYGEYARPATPAPDGVRP